MAPVAPYYGRLVYAFTYTLQDKIIFVKWDKINEKSAILTYYNFSENVIISLIFSYVIEKSLNSNQTHQFMNFCHVNLYENAMGGAAPNAGKR